MSRWGKFWGATLGVLLALAAPAYAEWDLTERQAVFAARHAVAERYGQPGSRDPHKTSIGDVAARCRPQAGRARRDGKAHRWVCDWSVDRCTGRLLIAGHSGRLRYGAAVLRGVSCP